MKMTLRRAALTAAGTLALALTAACSGGGSEETPTETNEVNLAEPETPIVAEPVENYTPPPPPPVENAAPTPTETSDDFADPATMQDDADAAGMTSRVDRGEGDQAQPARE